MFTMVSFAQDVIVKKDGSTILSKVEEVSDTQVKYKKHSNLNGPTYTVNVSDLQCINYENGEKETFNSTPVVETPIQETTVTYPNNPSGVTGERTLSDAELLHMSRYGGDYWEKQLKKGKYMKYGGIIGGIIIAGIGTVWTLFAINDEYASDEATYVIPSTIAGVLGCTALYLSGNSKMKKAQRMMSTSVYQYNIPLGKNTMLTADVDLIKDNMTRQQTLGLGFHLNF